MAVGLEIGMVKIFERFLNNSKKVISNVDGSLCSEFGPIQPNVKMQARESI